MSVPLQELWASDLRVREKLAHLAPAILAKTLLVVLASELAVMVFLERLGLSWGPWTSLLDAADEDVDRLRGYMEARAAGQPAPTHYECKGKRRNGTTFPAAVAVSFVTYEGQPASLVVVQDLTEHKRLHLLESLLPVCCVCGKVRDESGTATGRDVWRPLEEYVIEHSDATISHGYCPDCYTSYRREQGLDADGPPEGARH